MFDTAHRKSLFSNLEVLEVLHGPTTFKVRHPGYGVCVLDRFVGPGAREEAARKQSVLARIHAKGVCPGIRQPVAIAANTDGWYLLTTFFEGVSLNCADRERFRASPRAVGDLGVVLLSLLERVHAAGVRHGRLTERHVIVGPQIGLVGLSEEPTTAARDDVQAVARIVYERLTERPWTPSAPPVTASQPTLGTALDQWLAAVRSGDSLFDSAREARLWLRAVVATMPGDGELRDHRSRGPSSMRAPTRGRSEFLSPPSSEMLARLH